MVLEVGGALLGLGGRGKVANFDPGTVGDGSFGLREEVSVSPNASESFEDFLEEDEEEEGRESVRKRFFFVFGVADCCAAFSFCCCCSRPTLESPELKLVEDIIMASQPHSVYG